MKMSMGGLLLLCLCAMVLAHAEASHTPEQLRLALTGVKGEMVVGWATQKNTDHSTVEYTCAGCGHFTAKGQATHYYLPALPPYTSPQLHFATLKGLNSSTTYSYRVGDPSKAWSDVHQFTTEPANATTISANDKPLRIVSLGDQGIVDGAKSVLAGMLTVQAKAPFDFLIHAGDISYANGKQPIWDQWGQLVQPFAAQVPWMVSPGNHEMHDWSLPYLYRFAMPAAQSGANSGNMFYSFDYGNVHVIALDSEASSFSDQVEWVKKDLRRVNRAITPWIISFWHRPWYCSSTVHEDSGKAMRQALEDVFYSAQVDLVITGHVHSYERTLPVYKGAVTPNAPLYITNGVGGNSLDNSWDQPPVWSARRVVEYGFGRVEIFNATHLHWTLLSANASAVLDDVWLVRPR